MEDKSKTEKFEKIILGLADNEKIKVEVMIKEPRFLDKLRKKKSRIYEINRHTVLSQNIKMAKILIDIPEFLYEKKSDSEVLYLTIESVAIHTKKLAKLISILLKERNIRFLLRNLDNEDILTLVSVTIGIIDYQSFMSIMALFRSKVSLKKN